MANKEHLAQKNLDVAKKGNLKREIECFLKAPKSNVIITFISKQEYIRCDKLENVEYVLIETMRSIT